MAARAKHRSGGTRSHLGERLGSWANDGVDRLDGAGVKIRDGEGQRDSSQLLGGSWNRDAEELAR